MGLYINPNDIEIYHSGYRQHKYITRLYKNGHWVYKYAPDVEKQTLKENIKWENDMIKNNRSYHSPNGKVYGPEHYKKAIKYDKADLKKVNQRLKRTPKIQKKFMRFTAKTLTQVSKHSTIGRKALDKIFG